MLEYIMELLRAKTSATTGTLFELLLPRVIWTSWNICSLALLI
jgi:hypothetical protein